MIAELLFAVKPFTKQPLCVPTHPLRLPAEWRFIPGSNDQGFPAPFPVKMANSSTQKRKKSRNSMYRLVAVAARFILPCFLRIHVTGKEHMPQEGGVVLACNHVSWLDVLFLAFLACLAHRSEWRSQTRTGHGHTAIKRATQRAACTGLQWYLHFS